MIIYGKNPVKEALINKRVIYKIYVDNKFNDLDYLNEFKKNEINIEFLSKEELFKIADTTQHQGIAADVKDYTYLTLKEMLELPKPLKIIALDELTDPHNLGAIIRTAEAFSISCILLSNKNQVLVNPTVVKVSTGAIERVNICLVSNLNNALITMKKNNIIVYGTTLQTDNSYRKIPKDKDVCVVLGNEGKGIRKLVQRNCDFLVKIPMSGKINSLNVSVAGALLMDQMKSDD